LAAAIAFRAAIFTSDKLDPFAVQKENQMAEISGRLIMDLLPEGDVKIAFVPNMGGGTISPLMARNIDGAEDDLIKTFGQTPARAAAIRGDVMRAS
jgi:hypothetical protein